MEAARTALENVLKIHFCDLEETTEHESHLSSTADRYFEHKNINSMVKILDSLADEKRLKIFHLLSIREMCNCEMTAAIKTTQPNLTYHVKKLENAGVVEQRRDGKYIYYSLRDIPEVKKLQEISQ